MQLASPLQTHRSRLSGVGFVVALHILMIWALANGLLPKLIPQPKLPTDVTVIPATPQPEPPPPPALRDPSLPPPPQAVWAPRPETVDFQVAAENAPSASPEAQPTLADRPSTPPGPAAQTPPAASPAAALAPGLLCSQMGRPEVPALGVDGFASLRAVGTLRQGRVVAVELTVLRGLSDRRAMRQLATLVERTLRETYLCGTHNGQFTQDFDFRIE